MSKGLKSPGYTQINRRSKKVKIDIRRQVSKGGISIVVDSTWLKVYGEGEWKVGKHGASKRRTRRKLHAAVNPDTLEIVSVELTENSEGDGCQVDRLLKEIIEEAEEFIGDGLYDTYRVLKRLSEGKIKGIIPSRENALLRKGSIWEPRNRSINEINKMGRKKRKKKERYHRRSQAEVAIYRYKTIMGRVLQSRKIEYEKTEIKVKCKILNRKTEIGMPISYKVAA
jgi:hypothetical protein